jgi:hypothetical protein
LISLYSYNISLIARSSTIIIDQKAQCAHCLS